MTQYTVATWRDLAGRILGPTFGPPYIAAWDQFWYQYHWALPQNALPQFSLPDETYESFKSISISTYGNEVPSDLIHMPAKTIMQAAENAMASSKYGYEQAANIKPPVIPGLPDWKWPDFKLPDFGGMWDNFMKRLGGLNPFSGIMDMFGGAVNAIMKGVTMLAIVAIVGVIAVVVIWIVYRYVKKKTATTAERTPFATSVQASAPGLPGAPSGSVAVAPEATR